MKVMNSMEYFEMVNAEKDRKIRELEVANEMLRKAILQLTDKGNPADVRVSRSDFLKMYDMALSEMNGIYGYNFTVSWHGVYCDCGDGATPSNYIIPAVKGCEEEMDGEEY